MLRLKDIAIDVSSTIVDQLVVDDIYSLKNCFTNRDVAGKNIHEMRAIKIVFIFYFNFVYD